MNRFREFVYRGPIRISEADMNLFSAGKKRCTIRRGVASVAEPDTYVASRSRRFPVSIELIEKDLLFRDLSEKHAQGEGFDTVEELRRDLLKYYPDIRDGDRITAIWFRPR